MADYQKDKLLTRGKTKEIYEVVGDDNVIIAENKTDITAFDDKKFTKQFKTKAVSATTTTCRIFELLKQANIPVAFIEQTSPTEFLAQKCNMIPLEVVARRFAIGSYLKRHPELTPKNNKQLHRFHRLITEFFLKTNEGEATGLDGKKLVQGLTTQDPFIINPYGSMWNLFHSKKTAWDPEANLNKRVLDSNIIRNHTIEEMDDIIRNVFLLLEGACSVLGLQLIDLKIEFGINKQSQLVVADVIDNDSWRLKDDNWKEISKEAFRQGKPLNEVEENYLYVASLVKQFRIPKQAFVFWKGSENDVIDPFTYNIVPDCLKIENVIISAHKSPQKAINGLNRIQAKYPDGGVIIAMAGKSNGLGPMIATRTTWPVIYVPIDINEHPENLFGNINMPSNVPMLTCLDLENAIQAALNILAQKNPVLYMQRQRQIEELDK
ncbi:MAG: phosphoribosylaminoimidazolesuccinocarboxamide synthase [bacterium]